VRAIALWLTCVLISFGGLAHAQQSPDADSFERIREALQRPPSRLSLELPKADFSIYIERRRPLQDIFERPPWVTVPPEFVAPGAVSRVAGGSIDPGIIAHSVSRAVRTRQAREEVRRAIAEYCVAHRDEPGAAAICGEPPR
jgi:hypothetical protein